jgi:hypothetical protein
MLLVLDQHTRVQALSGFLLIPLFSEESDLVKIPKQEHPKISFLLSEGCLSLCLFGRHTCIAFACSVNSKGKNHFKKMTL